MATCIVPTCKIYSQNFSPETRSVHRLPVDKKVLEQWHKIIPKGRNPWNENSKICSIHFTEDCFKQSGFKAKNKWKRLKPDAVPSLYLGLKSAGPPVRRDRQENPEDLRVAELAKCGWLGLALDKKPVKPSILKPKSTAKMPQEREPASKETVANSEEENDASNKLRELKCPLCLKVFVTPHSTSGNMRHIIDEEMSESPSLSDVKPILDECCQACSTSVSSEPEQTISSDIGPESKVQPAQTPAPRFTCLGCDHQFNSLHRFEGHIEKEHSDAVEKYLFPKYSDYTEWKEDMETRSDISYLDLTRKIFVCKYVTCDDNTVLVCPSCLIVQRDNNGFHVTFYKQHFGHLCNNYIMPDIFESYLITEDLESDTQNSGDKNTTNEQSEDIIEVKNFDTSLTVNDGTKNKGRRKLAHTIRVEENATPNVSPETIQPPSSFNGSYMDIVDENLELMSSIYTKRWRRMRNEPVIKTKVGSKWVIDRNEVNNSRKVKSKIKPSFLPKAKNDWEYEVQERDNDCNVLILKV